MKICDETPLNGRPLINFRSCKTHDLENIMAIEKRKKLFTKLIKSKIQKEIIKYL